MRIVGTTQAFTKFPTVDQFATAIEDMHAAGYRGQGVTVAVVDSGVDLTDPVTSKAVVDGINLSGSGAKDDLQDRVYHGSLVARTILTMAPEAKLFVVRIFGDRGECSDQLAGDGLALAAEHGDLTNASIGSPAAHPAITAAVRRHEAVQKPLIAAAGNGGDARPETIERSYPAAEEYATAVAAWDRSFLIDPAMDWIDPQPARYSSSYPEVDITALGRIPQLWEDGTSFAAPVIAGASAVFASFCRATGRPWNDAINYAWLISHARQLPGWPARNDQTGFGLFTLRPFNPEHRLEVDVFNLAAFLDGSPISLPDTRLENRAPGGIYGYLRPIITALGGRVSYDEARHRAVFRI